MKTCPAWIALLLVPACLSTPPEPAPRDLHELVQQYGAAAGWEVTCDEGAAALLGSMPVSRVDAEGRRGLRVERPSGASAAEPSRLEVVALQHAAAADLAGILSDLLRSASAGAGAAPVQILADARTNSLLVSAPEPSLAQLRELIARLDRRVEVGK